MHHYKSQTDQSVISLLIWLHVSQVLNLTVSNTRATRLAAESMNDTNTDTSVQYFGGAQLYTEAAQAQ